MEPTPNQPTNGYSGNAPTTTSGNGQFSTTAAHATGEGPYPTDAAAPAGGLQDTWSSAVASGKQWLSDTGLLDQANQLPKAAKDAYDQVRSRVSGLSTTQVAVGVGVLAAAVAFLATRGRHRADDDDNDGSYRKRPRRSPFDHGQQEPGQRPWGARRFGEGRGGRVSAGSGYSSESPASSWREERQGGRPWGGKGGQRRDQGPGRYDSRTSGRQNPNNLDDLNSAF